MRIAGTGHRPDKIGGYGQLARQRLVNFAGDLLEEIHPTEVISGMALGWDQALAWAAVDCDIPFLAYVPFAGQESAWPPQARREYAMLLSHAHEEKRCCTGGYSPRAMQIRNEMMVNDADWILALWNGSPGGTANCVSYAQKKGKPIFNVYQKWELLCKNQA